RVAAHDAGIHEGRACLPGGIVHQAAERHVFSRREGVQLDHKYPARLACRVCLAGVECGRVSTDLVLGADHARPGHRQRDALPARGSREQREAEQQLGARSNISSSKYPHSVLRSTMLTSAMLTLAAVPAVSVRFSCRCAIAPAEHPPGSEIPVVLAVCTSFAVPGAVCDPGAKKFPAVNAGSFVALPPVATQTMSRFGVHVPLAVALRYVT